MLILFGALFAGFERPDREGTLFSSFYFWQGLFFATVFNAAAFYAALTYPEWMWMYFVDVQSHTWSEIAYIFVFVYYVPFVAGFYIGLDLKKWSSFFWFVFLLLMLAAEVWIVWYLFDRYSVVGTREQYYQSTAISLFDPQNPLGWVFNGAVAVMVVHFIVVWFWHKRRKQAVKRQSGLSL